MWWRLFSFYRRGKARPIKVFVSKVTKLVSAKIKKQEDSKQNQLSPNSLPPPQGIQGIKLEPWREVRRGEMAKCENLRNTVKMKRKSSQDIINKKVCAIFFLYPVSFSLLGTTTFN